MDKSATLNLRINPTVKEQDENVLRQLGIPMYSAIDLFLNQVTLVKGIPFPVTLPQAPGTINADLMDAREIHARLQKGLEDAEQGRVKDARRAFEVFRNER